MATRMGKFKDEIVPVEVIKKAAGQEVAKERSLRTRASTRA